jgi:hypothetical protein
MSEQAAALKFVQWVDSQILSCARGDNLTELDVEPKGSFWLGRVASEESVIESSLGDLGERLDPCAIGVRIKPRDPAPHNFEVKVEACVWSQDGGAWRKFPKFRESIHVVLGDATIGDYTFGGTLLTKILAEVCGSEGLSAEVRVEIREDADGHKEFTVLFVNTSPKKHEILRDTNFYECGAEVTGLNTNPFILESLPDSFRYDRKVVAYGINCGVETTLDGSVRTVDTVTVDKKGTSYWNLPDPTPDFTFKTLSQDPLDSLRSLVMLHAKWGKAAWSTETLDRRAQRDSWSNSMKSEAVQGATDFWIENERLANGIGLLESNQRLLEAFKMMNSAVSYAANGRYESWRPFQIGFLLANLGSIANPQSDSDIADVVWFTTGGGKTETYLGLLITAALFDRLEGKASGITAWSRFPLRMLSLQQTQRFADAMAGAERVRRESGILGDPFSTGFFVGQAATPNSLKEEAGPEDPYDVDDDAMPQRCKILTKCPFCHADSISMEFERRLWRLEHRCSNDACPWPEQALPFYIVDDEIYRFLPTVVVGTLDKAASVSMNAGMRCFMGSPLGLCSENGHGYTYAPRSGRATGCLVPRCPGSRQPLTIDRDRYAPTFRLQDELHLLKDSLGAVDAHYESLLDYLELELSNKRPKILASSATLTGYDRQIRLLYGRSARVFPLPGPSADEGFWVSSSKMTARRYVAVAPRGVTIDYAVERTVTELQRIVRSLAQRPEEVCASAGVDPQYASKLVELYGVNVVYGNTIRDLDAVSRSFETQLDVDGPLNTASLTGRTPFDEVRTTLDRLQSPEETFEDRLHLITASSMMSHGVDIDRLNLMVMLGTPLSAAEFIQATARIGRAFPGCVYVMQKMGRERDAAVFRCFDKFVLHGDRFIEPIPITRTSRNVLTKTIAGLYLARLLAVHEPNSQGALTTVSKLRAYFVKAGVKEKSEVAILINMLRFDSAIDERLRRDIEFWVERFLGNLHHPSGTSRFPSDLSPTGSPMRSLRDVEEEVPIFGY